MFKINVERTSGVAIVRCIGRLVRGEAVSALRDAVVSEKNSQRILLDLSDVQAFDAGGVNALVWLHQWAMRRGIKIKLVNPSTLVREILTRFQLDRLFDVSSLHDALVVLAGRECCQLAVGC
jgi:anti-anti-sigma factor